MFLRPRLPRSSASSEAGPSRRGAKPEMAEAESEGVVVARKNKSRRRGGGAGGRSRQEDRAAVVAEVPDFPYPLKLQPQQFIFQKRTLGEGQMGKVLTASYNGILVACKTRRPSQARASFEDSLTRELEYAAELSVCRFMNQYIGVLTCKRSEITFEGPSTKKPNTPNALEHFVVQRYFENGDLSSYIGKKKDTELGVIFHPMEIVQIAISLFAALTDAHKLDIGILDLKRENILIDDTGSAWITDFGSCVKMKGKEYLMLGKQNVRWTKDVASPEMISNDRFYKSSDVFMGMMLIGELLAAHMEDEEYQSEVLLRDESGLVFPQTEKLHPIYHEFFPILKQGLENDPTQRPTALEVYEYFDRIRQAALDAAMRLSSLPQSFGDTTTAYYPLTTTTIQTEQVIMASSSSSAPTTTSSLMQVVAASPPSVTAPGPPQVASPSGQVEVIAIPSSPSFEEAMPLVEITTEAAAVTTGSPEEVMSLVENTTQAATATTGSFEEVVPLVENTTRPATVTTSSPEEVMPLVETASQAAMVATSSCQEVVPFVEDTTGAATVTTSTSAEVIPLVDNASQPATSTTSSSAEVVPLVDTVTQADTVTTSSSEGVIPPFVSSQSTPMELETQISPSSPEVIAGGLIESAQVTSAGMTGSQGSQKHSSDFGENNSSESASTEKSKENIDTSHRHKKATKRRRPKESLQAGGNKWDGRLRKRKRVQEEPENDETSSLGSERHKPRARTETSPPLLREHADNQPSPPQAHQHVSYEQTPPGYLTYQQPSPHPQPTIDYRLLCSPTFWNEMFECDLSFCESDTEMDFL